MLTLRGARADINPDGAPGAAPASPAPARARPLWSSAPGRRAKTAHLSSRITTAFPSPIFVLHGAGPGSQWIRSFSIARFSPITIQRWPLPRAIRLGGYLPAVRSGRRSPWRLSRWAARASKLTARPWLLVSHISSHVDAARAQEVLHRAGCRGSPAPRSRPKWAISRVPMP